jgi:NADH:ubiquinone oxidoreductase subunit D
MPLGLIDDIYLFVKNFLKRLEEIESMLTENRIWKERLIQVGVVSYKEAIEWGFSGVMLRGSGIPWDLRKNIPYEIYTELNFDIPLGKIGDCYDRYLVRIEEMRQSIKIIFECINTINEGPIKNFDTKQNLGLRHDLKNSMESVINHFKFHSQGL